MIYIQLITLFFAFACALHDVPAVDNFTYYGSNQKEQRKFHWFNWILKGCYVGLVYFLRDWQTALACGLIIWAVFDPVVAIYRTPKKVWYYLSTGNRTDRALLKTLGKYAGAWKVAICIILIIILNL